MKVQNFKRALLMCAVIGASNLSWASVSTWDITGGASGAKTLLNPSIIYNTAATTTTGGALTGTLYTAAALAPAAPVIFNTASCLGAAAGTPIELTITKPQQVTIDSAVATLWAPVKNPAGATIAITNAANTVGAVSLNGAVATVLPDSLTAVVGSYGTTYAKYCPATGNGSTFYPSGLIDVQESMTLDLTGLGASNTSFSTSLGLVVPTGKTLTIKLPAYNSGASAGNMGSTTFPINFTGFLSGGGNVVIDSAATGAGLVTFSGDTSLWSGVISLATASITANHTSLYKPALNFTSGVYASDISIPANTYQVVNLSGNSAITGAISGAGNLLVHSGTTAQYLLRLTADNSSWTGGLQFGDGTTASAYGAKLQLEHANALGASTATGGITLSFGATQVAAPVLAVRANVTTARTINVAGTNTTANALTIQTFDTFTSNFNGVISGTSGHGDALRLIGEGTTNLNAANLHVPSSSSYYATYVTGGGVVGMGTATSLGYNATANLTGALLDDGVQLTVPSASVTISNPLTLYQGLVTITAPSTGNTTTFTGVKSGSGGLIRGAGAGAWTESAAHTYTGGFTSSVAGAVINVGITAVAGTSSALGNGVVTLANGTVAFAGAYSLNNKAITATGPVTVDDGGYAVTIPADISGAGVITKKATAGTLTLTPPTGNTFTSALINLGGTVAAGNTNSVAGASNNMTLSSATSGFLPYGASTALKNTAATAITLKVQ